jgi:hypothetical protein
MLQYAGPNVADGVTKNVRFGTRTLTETPRRRSQTDNYGMRRVLPIAAQTQAASMFRLCTDVWPPSCGAASWPRLVYARRETRKVKGANRNTAFRLTAHHGADLEADKGQHRQQDRRAEHYNLCIVGHLPAFPESMGIPKLWPPIVKEKWRPGMAGALERLPAARFRSYAASKRRGG